MKHIRSCVHSSVHPAIQPSMHPSIPLGQPCRWFAHAPGVVGDDTFREGVVSGFLLILFSELGDKTFFIALLLALKQSQALVFAGTFGALAVMTVISVRGGFFLGR